MLKQNDNQRFSESLIFIHKITAYIKKKINIALVSYFAIKRFAKNAVLE